MQATSLYKCMSDELRLRVLNLLQPGPLCVCHLLDILSCDPVRMSKQLRYMKELGIIEGERHAQWIVYRLADPDSALLRDNLRCLREDAADSLSLDQDLQQRAALMEHWRAETPACAEALLPAV